MRIISRSGLFRSRSTIRDFATRDREELRIGAVMAHVQECGNLDGFASSRSERLALMTTAIRRGLLAWDRSSNRYSLSAPGRRYLDLCAPRPSGARPKLAGHSPRQRWGRRLRAASIAAAACVGLAGLDSTGTWSITGYSAGATFAATKSWTAAPLAASPGQAQVHALAVEPAPPEPSVDGTKPMIRQTAVAPSAKTATSETVPAAPPQPSAAADREPTPPRSRQTHAIRAQPQRLGATARTRWCRGRPRPAILRPEFVRAIVRVRPHSLNASPAAS